ncbi:MAG TPA: DNA internalization-related competence protein ComEC/Rec2 [Gemmatimonadaceae bacterium]|nr:DNA internalization-related competence protein ComEC/Rec2 [Gemmatimonadaceae bacterium]
MPLVALSVAAYAAGLICGFAAAHSIAACAMAALFMRGAVARRGSWVVIAALLIAGDAVATERRWRDARCLTRLSDRESLTIALATPAERGALARGRTVEPGCALRVAVSVRGGEAAYGATVRVSGAVFVSGDGLLVKGASVGIVKPPGVLARLRSRASRALQRDFGEDAPLAKALLIAETADLGPDVRDRFATAGLVHILSISGLHVTIVASAVLLLLEAARLPRRVTLIGGCVLTVFYVALIGAPAPAVRSAVMFCALAMSRLMQRPTSSWASLALGAAWPLPGDPRIVLDIGWQLTVAGMVALIAGGTLNARFVAPRFTGWRARLATELCTGVIATVVTAPIVAWYFGRTSLVAPIANIAANPVANVLQPALFLALALGWWPGASGLVADACRPGLRALDGIAGGAAALPGADFGVAPTLAGAVLLSVAIGAVLAACKAKRPLVPLVSCLVALGAMLWLPLVPRRSGEMELHAIDVGQGDALALRTPKGRWVLIDAGRAWTGGDAGRRAVVPYVRQRGGDVAVFILTHPDEDHVGGAASVIDALRPREFWDAAYVAPSERYRAALAAAAQRNVEWHRAQPGHTLVIDGVSLHVLAPDSAWTVAQHGPNEASTVVMAEFGDTRMLLTGDAEDAEERWLVEEWGDALHADVLKAGHHGSRTSSTPEFLDAVRARIAVVSVGAGNSYGHPHRDVIDAFAARGMIVLRTDQLGSVVVSTDGRRIKVAGSDGAWVVPP